MDIDKDDLEFDGLYRLDDGKREFLALRKSDLDRDTMDTNTKNLRVTKTDTIVMMRESTFTSSGGCRLSEF